MIKKAFGWINVRAGFYGPDQVEMLAGFGYQFYLFG
jgi:hypothetical protein